MLSVKEPKARTIKKTEDEQVICYHCGAPCIINNIYAGEKLFCCEGCKLVYELLADNGLCDYYKLQSHPGLSQIKPLRNNKFTYLDDDATARQLYKFTDGKYVIATFYIPGVHCTSCMWLLEHLHKLHKGITESRLNFTTKEVSIHFLPAEISFRKVVELLATIGYEPYISLDDAGKEKAKKVDKSKIYKLGIAGFCFGNIMMMSFPEYLSRNLGMEHQYTQLFRILNLVLSVPVFFFCATEFFVSAWKGLQQKVLNIDAPIVLALAITYSRSIYEILTGAGGGYLDSMSGIVFFMLVGRVVQERAYRSISFNRDYKSYFPIAVNVVTDRGVETRGLDMLKEKDIVQLHNDEIIPADSLVVKGNARIDYSFVTGESEPLTIKPGETVYAGGRQVGEELIIQIIKPVAGSYLTSLWNHYAFSRNKVKENQNNSSVHVLSKYFTYVLFTLAAATAIYWSLHDSSKILPSVSAMLIVACPCALLLAATYTNGNLLRILSANGLFLRDATVIEQLGNIDHIVFDKTGTLTQGSNHFSTTGHQLSEEEKSWLSAVVRSSKHPYSRALVAYLGDRPKVMVSGWKETTGKGLEAYIGCNRIMVGSAAFIGVSASQKERATLFVRINDKVSSFYFIPEFRESVTKMMPKISMAYALSLLSGDNDKQRDTLQLLFGGKAELNFEQKPIDKLQYIERLQLGGEKVMMVGDGLNDAGALQQSNVGITLADDINNFTPSCDAILDAKKFGRFPALLKLAKSGRLIVMMSFVVSVMYNVIGLGIAMKGLMSPMIAAILMPVSTLSIVLITTGASSLLAKYYGLSIQANSEAA